jgi:hypothetical protein
MEKINSSYEDMLGRAFILKQVKQLFTAHGTSVHA